MGNREKIFIFDSTLRDGEQTPGAKLNLDEKIRIAHQLARLNVDVIEAGFPISSPGELKAVERISRDVKGPVICSLARCIKKDVDAAWESVRDAERPRIHVFLAASEIHMRQKLKKDPELLLEQAREAVKYARSFTSDVVIPKTPRGRMKSIFSGHRGGHQSRCHCDQRAGHGRLCAARGIRGIDTPDQGKCAGYGKGSVECSLP